MGHLKTKEKEKKKEPTLSPGDGLKTQPILADTIPTLKK